MSLSSFVTVSTFSTSASQLLVFGSQSKTSVSGLPCFEVFFVTSGVPFLGSSSAIDFLDVSNGYLDVLTGVCFFAFLEGVRSGVLVAPTDFRFFVVFPGFSGRPPIVVKYSVTSSCAPFLVSTMLVPIIHQE